MAWKLSSAGPLTIAWVHSKRRSRVPRDKITPQGAPPTYFLDPILLHLGQSNRCPNEHMGAFRRVRPPLLRRLQDSIWIGEIVGT